MSYQPSEELLEKYADVMINFALNGGEGVKNGEVVQLRVSEVAKPLLVTLRRAVLKAGAHPIIFYTPDEFAREHYELASDEQLSFFPKKFLKGLVDEIDHTVAVLSETDKKELDGIDSGKIMAAQKALKPYMDWRREKEGAGEYTWTLCMYGTQAMADEVDLSLEEYWDEIVKACYLDDPQPAEKWKALYKDLYEYKDRLDALPIEKLHIEAPDTDLWITIGDNRKWLGGSGRNVPSFELFISPDWRGTEGKIQFTEPLYRYGNLIKDAYLEFKDGRVVKATASAGEDILKEMIAVENADKVGEFSLTDRRFSRITKFMGETLFDENVGGENGNTHIAVGAAYRDSYTGDQSNVSEEEWESMGYNNSVVHTDIVATSNRLVTAYLKDGSNRVIYKDGEYQV
ncbi:aminopeptidase [Candidatus Pelagisphaera phototrophica]|uniref:aminopeptidase n=1 Tax=Candidatus Pelagisphaera phototrophica TaxID=2684113 RepID=UPI0019E32F3D|nr:aminopeptidase [Candidatus Pelagisphaera phototrophica]QXD31697.1 aminopeptidase [Candidatus Pelagisphaera phototrophica]